MFTCRGPRCHPPTARKPQLLRHCIWLVGHALVAFIWRRLFPAASVERTTRLRGGHRSVFRLRRPLCPGVHPPGQQGENNAEQKQQLQHRGKKKHVLFIHGLRFNPISTVSAVCGLPLHEMACRAGRPTFRSRRQAIGDAALLHDACGDIVEDRHEVGEVRVRRRGTFASAGIATIGRIKP